MHTIVLAVALASAHAQTPPATDAGKALLETRCSTCHTLDTALSKRANADGWRDTIKTMISVGAQLTDDEAETLVRYLAEHYGPGSTQPSAAPRSELPDGPGKDVLTKKCFQCHGQAMWKDLRHDRRGWDGVLYRMVGRGALWTQEEIDAMGAYLAQTFGRQP